MPCETARSVINLSRDLQAWFGRGFGRANLFQMKAFFLAYPDTVQTVSGLSDAALVADRKETRAIRTAR